MTRWVNWFGNDTRRAGKWTCAASVTLLASACGIAGSGSEGGDDAPRRAPEQRVERIREALSTSAPGAQVTTSGGIVRAFGATLASGNTPDEAAAAFVRDQAQTLGVRVADLQQVNGGGAPSAAPKPLGLMLDRATGKYKFYLYRYQQRRGGTDVYDSELRTLVRNGGNNPVVWSSSTVKSLGSFTVPAQAKSLAVNQAKTLSALQQLTDFQGRPVGAGATITNVSTPTATIFAGTAQASAAPRMAMTYVAETANPPGKWKVIASAETGDVLHTESMIHFVDVQGNVSGNVTEGAKAMDCSDEVPTAFAQAEVSLAGGGTATTDDNGDFTLANSGSGPVDVTSAIGGVYFDVSDYGGANEILTQNVTPPGPVSLLHNPANSTDLLRAQSNGYRNAMDVRNFLLQYVPDYPVISTQTNFPVSVNRTDGYCPGNAWYDYSSINFCVGNSTYGNTSFGSISYHEYGHHIVTSGGSGQGAYGEGMSDTIATLIAQDPGTGYGFYLNDCSNPLRTADNDCQYSATSCSSCGSEVHACGNLISGTIWSIRENLALTEPTDYVELINSLVLSSVPMHTGTAIDASIAEDLLILDDDDGVLSNGTPHSTEICDGFAAHGMTCPIPPSGLSVGPSDEVDLEGPTGGPFSPDPVDYSLTNLGPDAQLDYQITSNVAWLIPPADGQVALDETVTASVQIDQAEAAALPNGDHNGALTFTNLNNGKSTVRSVRLRVGIPSPVYTEDFESGLNGFTIDAGSSNLWHLASDCASTQSGHSAPASLYFGNSSCNFDNGDVFGTATSPTITVEDTTLVLLQLNYFLSTEGNGSFDRASVQVSVNGGTYNVVASSYGTGELLSVSSAGWQSIEVDLTSLVAGLPSADLQIRFGFDSIDSLYNTYDGFLVDDLVIRALDSTCTTDADCDDGLSCSGVETCVNGSCVAGDPISCDDGVECTVDTCDELTSCVNTPDDSACSDGSLCTGVETCDPLSGCQPGTPLDCDDGDLCTTDGCDPATGCTATPVDCDDGDACTAETCDPETGCQPGTPIDCDDSNVCTTDSCDSATGCANEPISCDDGDACTVDSCDPVTGCSSTPLSCDDGNECTVDSCDPATGCSNTPATGSCSDDGDSCTDDVCNGGVCTHPDNGSCGPLPFLESGGQVVMEAENFHDYIPRANHTWTPISNGNASGGQLLRAEPNVNLNMNTGYVTGSPELRYEVNFTTTGTYYVWVRGIGPTQDDDSCHVGIDGTGPGSSDRISSFSSSLSWSRNTMDGNVATINVTTPGLHTINVWMREDGFSYDKLVLTTSSGFVPQGNGPAQSPQGNPGQCGSDAECNDGNSCTTDSCVGGTCEYDAVPDGDTCGDDGNSCTDDVCSAGQCTHPNNTDPCADDGNSCTDDICGGGVCTHPDNGTCQNSGPCASYCSNPVQFSGNFQSGNLGTGATCHETTGNLNGGVCGNFTGGRTLSVNGQVMSCNNGNWPSLPQKVNGGYCVTTTAGNWAWAYFATW